MAATLWIVRKADDDNFPVVDGITTVIVNDDDAETEANVLTATEALAVAAGIDLPSGYFSTAAIWSASGQLDADGDAIFFDERLEAIS